VIYKIRVNGADHSVDTEGDTPLLWVLRDLLGLTGTKFGCGVAQCGACTVHLNGAATRSCVLPIEAAVGSDVITIEGIGDTELGRKMQQAWLAIDVPQCGYCQGGQILAATALLKATPHPTEPEIDAAMSGNICRCGTYVRIRAAIRHVAGTSAAQKQVP
jgi:isoquinoline 1-oxidoreductase alpha subunit